MLFALACIAIIRLLKPFVTIRIGEICAFRIGHLAGNTECYLCEKEAWLHPRRTLDIWTWWGRKANKQLAKMYARKLHISPVSLMGMNLIHRAFQGWEQHRVESAQYDRDIYNLMEKQAPHIAFTEEEMNRGERELKRLGIDRPFVCLIVRDSAYLAKHEPKSNYHHYRDSDIADYGLAAEALVKRGYTVVRMGEIVEKPARSPFILDYATNGMRSDFMDVYLGANCTFCISTGIGFDAVPMVFRKPIVYVNYAPLEYLMTFVNPSLAIWKHHYKDDKRMSPKEIFDSGAGQYLFAQSYEQAGIKLVANTPEEIRDVVEEMCDLVAKRPIEESQEQSAFWDNFPRGYSPFNARPLHGEIRMRIGREFLKSYAG